MMSELTPCPPAPCPPCPCPLSQTTLAVPSVHDRHFLETKQVACRLPIESWITIGGSRWHGFHCNDWTMAEHPVLLITHPNWRLAEITRSWSIKEGKILQVLLRLVVPLGLFRVHADLPCQIIVEGKRNYCCLCRSMISRISRSFTKHSRPH